MTQAPPAFFKIPAKSPQPARGVASRARKAAAAQPKAARRAASRVAGVETRAATRGDGEVIELEYGITVYPAREEKGRWRAVWYEDGKRQQCEAATEEKLAARLEKVTERLAADAPNMKRSGADLIAHYLDPDRLPVAERWSRKHAHTQRRLCERFAAPVIAAVICQDINFNRNVLKRAYLAIGWRDADGSGKWTWHSLRHVFCHRPVHLEARPYQRVPHGRARQRPHHAGHVRRLHRRRPRPRPHGHRVTTPGRDEGPGTVHEGCGLPGSFRPPGRNSMPDTDLHQPDLGPLNAAVEAAELAQAASGLVSAYGYCLADSDPLAPLARDIARSMTEAGPAPAPLGAA